MRRERRIQERRLRVMVERVMEKLRVKFSYMGNSKAIMLLCPPYSLIKFIYSQLFTVNIYFMFIFFFQMYLNK